MWEGINRRKFPRVSYKCNIVITSVSGKRDNIAAYTENVGMGGICVVLKKKIDLFKNVGLELLLEDGGPTISCKGTVVWVVKRSNAKNIVTYDTGIEFTTIDESDMDRIKEIVKKILSST